MKHIVYNNKKIFYRAGGKGKPVMLVHGFAETGAIWDYQAEKLKNDFFVMVPDLPGSGKSQMLEGKPTMADYAIVIKAIAEAEGIDGAMKTLTLIGHSMGGYITLAFAEKYPDLLNGMGLFHSSVYADDAAKIATRKKGIEFIKHHGAKTFLKSTIPNLFSEETRTQKPQLVEYLIRLSKDFSTDALIQYYYAMIKRPDRTSVVKSFKKPVLFIIGKKDNAVPLELSLQQCHIPYVSYIKILQHSGHTGMWEERRTSTGFLRRFLKDLQ